MSGKVPRFFLQNLLGVMAIEKLIQNLEAILIGLILLKEKETSLPNQNKFEEIIKSTLQIIEALRAIENDKKGISLKDVIFISSLVSAFKKLLDQINLF